MFKYILTVGFCLSANALLTPVMAQKPVTGKPYHKSEIKVRPTGAVLPLSVQTGGNGNGAILKSLAAFGNSGSNPVYFPLPKSSAMNKQNLAVDQKIALALQEIKTELGLMNTDQSYLLKETSTDDLGMKHHKFTQLYQGVEVWGGEMILHEKGETQFLNGRFYAEPSLDMRSSLSEAEAFLLVQDFLKTKTYVKALTAKEVALIQYSGPIIKPIIYHVDGKAVLCWFIECKPNLLSTWRCFVDANSGKIVQAYNQSCTIDGPKTSSSLDLNGTTRTINTYEKGGKTYLIDASKTMFSASSSNLPDDPIGAIWTIDAQNTDLKSFVQISSLSNSNWPTKGVSAHYNAGIAYEYYKNFHSRNSINGMGGNIISVINVSEQNGQGMDNAYWTGEMMCYGNGDVAFKPLAGSLDVAGHEMTHGVVQNSANLEYQGQSGAMNESMADIFACMMDRDDWTLGEEVVKPLYFPSGALRSLADPHNGGGSLNDNGFQPRTMSEYYTGSQDNGGVHINSGIPNWAFYKFASSVGKDKAEKVYYRALTKYLTKTAKFVDLRIAVVQSCIDLYGDNSAEYQAARSAFSAVGIYATDPGGGGGSGGSGTSTSVDISVNPGQDYILSYDDSSLDPATLYQSSTSGSNYVVKSSREMKRRPSVCDNGSFAVFVGSDSKIYKLTLGSSPVETVLSNEAIWDNAVVSKDGKRIAAITTSVDSAIYVYDFSVQQWKEFKLYNPTYSAGIHAGSVLYADALEFDYTGEKVVYDARNVINNAGGTAIDYWDIGVIQVWDNTANTYSGGKIEKLYTQLPEDVSIGNPTFSKNSPYIMAFDYIDAGANKYAVIGKNLTTNQDDIIVLNDQLGYPNYSKLDNQLIYDVTTVQNQKWLAIVSLEANKITGKGDEVTLIPDAYWGTWYSTGSRNLSSGAKDILTFSFQSLNPPAVGVISGNTIQVDIPSTTTTDFTKLVAVFSSSAFTTVKVDTTTQISAVTKNDFSKPSGVVYSVKAQDGSSRNYTVKVSSVNAINEVFPDWITLYPNPADKQLITRLTGVYELQILDILGKERMQVTGNNEMAVSTENLESGLYFVRIKQGDKVFAKSVLVQH